MDRTKKSSAPRQPKLRIAYSRPVPKRKRARKSVLLDVFTLETPRLVARTQSDHAALSIEGVELEQLFGRAVLRLVLVHDAPLYNRIASWVKDLRVEFEKTFNLWDRETALRELRKKLANPVLLDHRKNKKTTDDSKLLSEYNDILERIRPLPKSHHWRGSIRQALGKEFPEVDSPDFAPGVAAYDAAYRILSDRYTKGNIESLITRLKRARKRVAGRTHHDLREALHLLRQVQAKEPDTELGRRARLAIQLIENQYKKKIEPLLPPF